MASRYLTRFIKWGAFRKLADKAGAWRVELYVLYLAVRHLRTPLLPKAIAALTVVYALSPVDFVSDFIPLLGLVDDIIVVPLGITFALRLIPADVLADCRRQAALYPLSRKLKIWAAVAVFILLWMLIISYLFWSYLLS